VRTRDDVGREDVELRDLVALRITISFAADLQAVAMVADETVVDHEVVGDRAVVERVDRYAVPVAAACVVEHMAAVRGLLQKEPLLRTGG
jgi:hypothetical protein